MNMQNTMLLEQTDSIRNICQTYFIHTPITFFHYFKTYQDGGIITLTNNAEWLTHYFQKKYYELSSFRGKPTDYQDKYKLTALFDLSSPIVQDAAEGYNIGPGIVLIKPQEKFSEFYLFCVDSSYKNSYEFFLNHLDFFEKFILYFKDTAQRLRKKAENNVLYLPPLVTNSALIETNRPIKAALAPKRYYVDDLVYLTKKEVESIYWLGCGKSYSEIASILNRSPKTIEHHIEHAKKKLNVCKAAALVFRAKELGFI